MAHYEPPHQDLRCKQIQLFSSLVLKELINIVQLSRPFQITRYSRRPCKPQGKCHAANYIRVINLKKLLTGEYGLHVS